jgi:hypothetical protein
MRGRELWCPDGMGAGWCRSKVVDTLIYCQYCYMIYFSIKIEMFESKKCGSGLQN